MTFIEILILSVILASGTNILAQSVMLFWKHRLSLQRKNIFLEISEEPEVAREKIQKLNKSGIKKEESRIIKEFLGTLSKEDHINLGQMYANFHPFMIEFGRKRLPVYDIESGSLRIDETDKRNSLLRGLLELASTYKWNDEKASGFERIGRTKYGNKDFIYGRGLNEGYKEVLLERYFGIEPQYQELAELVSLLEYVIGKKKMEKLFFEGNLHIIYNCIASSCKYKDEEVYRFLRDLDIVYYYSEGETYAGVFTAKKAYNRLITDIAKPAIAKAKFYYNSKFDEDHLHYGSDTLWQNRFKTRCLLGFINSILKRRISQSKKERVLGLNATEKSALEIADHGNKMLQNLPIEYSIKK